jgi:tetratricopeptide (TPR) repeat protein
VDADAERRFLEARTYFDAGRSDAAQSILDGLLASQDAAPEVHVLAGVIAAQTGQLDEASSHLERALQVNPNQHDGLIWLANVRKSQREFDRAIALLRRALAIQPNDASVSTLLGICCLSAGEYKLAVESFLKVLKLEPRAAQAYFNLGLALRMQNRNQEALEAFLKALEYDPGRAQNYLQIFKQFQQLSRWSEAIDTLLEGRERHPQSPILAEALAAAYGRLNQPAKAESIYREMAQRDASSAIGYAKWLQEQGRFQDSVEVLESCISRDPLQGAAYRELAEAKAFSNLLDRAVAAFSSNRVDDKNRMHLAYAIAKSYEFEEQFEEAMQYYDIANDLAYGLYPICRTFDAEKTATDVEMMSGIYSRDVLEHMKGRGSKSDKPIFIVGMIRSGTTLLDQIVSSHPLVSSSGEQPFWNAEAEAVHRRWKENPDVTDLSKLSDKYLEILAEATDPAERITDKMPLNYRHLGLINCVFPKAKILHIRRNPLDTCLSIYTTFFAGGPNFVYNRTNIVALYKAYEKMMEHWRSTLPSDFLYELNYEDLISEPEHEIRGVLEFCNLPWDEACLSFHESSKAVSTPSRWQARQPIYGSSVERWRRFEPWLKELLVLGWKPSR